MNAFNHSMSLKKEVNKLVNQYEYDVQLVTTFDPLLDRKPYELVRKERRVKEYMRIAEMR